jgi:hypothetical protein
MRRLTILTALLLPTLLLVPATAHAQRYTVYEWEGPMDGWVEPTLHDYAVPKSRRTYDHFGKTVTEAGVTAHALEVEYGLTDRFTISAYADFESAHSIPLTYTAARAVGRYRFSNRYQRFFNPALYVEYTAPRSRYEANNEIETRLILERDVEDVRILLNPRVAFALADTSNAGPQAGFSGGVRWRRFYAVQPGVELHSELGRLGHGLPWREQQEVLMPTATIRFARAFTWELGAGVGLTHATDQLSLKSILHYEFQTVRPSHHAQ